MHGSLGLLFEARDKYGTSFGGSSAFLIGIGATLAVAAPSITTAADLIV
jgi:hypothetical protein